MKKTLAVEVTLSEAWFIVEGFWTVYGCAEPDPRYSDHETESNLEHLIQKWDARYALLLTWAKRVRRLERKEEACFGSYDSDHKMCRNACSNIDCIKITNIIKNKGLPK